MRSLLFILLIASLPVQAGSLSDFEGSAHTSSASSQSKSYSSGSSSGNSDSSSSDNWLGRLIVDTLVLGGSNSFAKANTAFNDPAADTRLALQDKTLASENVAGSDDDSIESKKPGDHLLPFFQASLSAGAGSHNIDWKDMRLETGYGAVAAVYRRSFYSEQGSSDELILSKTLLLYRMLFFDHLTVEFGVGKYTMDGFAHASDDALFTGFHLKFTDRLSLANRSTSVHGLNLNFDDSEWLVQYGIKNWSAQLAYRKLESPGMSINGPSLGLVYTF